MISYLVFSSNIPKNHKFSTVYYDLSMNILYSYLDTFHKPLQGVRAGGGTYPHVITKKSKSMKKSKIT